jgi:hypothetical protein
MSRANLTTVRRMVYENLGITGAEYGDLKTNQRYPSGYVDDAIAGADLNVMKTLLKSKQYHFSPEFFDVEPIPAGLPVYPLPVNTEMLSVRFYYNAEAVEEQGVEIPWDMYEMFTEPLNSTSLFTFVGEGTKKYGGYYSIKDHLLYTIPFERVSEISQVEFTGSGPNFFPIEEIQILVDSIFTITAQAGVELPSPLEEDVPYKVISDDVSSFSIETMQGDVITLDDEEFEGTLFLNPVVGYYKYISLKHPGTLPDEGDLGLKSPQSFEEAIAFLASANLLMKRADNPQQATYYMQQFQAMMGIYMTPSTNQQRVIDQ